MFKSIKIIETRVAVDGEQAIVRAATYQESAPFSGVFEVFDLDTCIFTNPVSGKSMLTVRCQFGNQDDEDAELLLELPNGAEDIVGVVGGGMDMVTRIDFS
jgi:hypothetical protein